MLRTMLTIDRYLLRQFLWVLIVLATSFVGLYVVVDMVNSYDELSLHASKHGNLLGVIATYYGQRSLPFFDLTSSLLILMAAMFSVAAFRRHNEMTALLAAGISKRRIVRSILIASAALTALAVVNREVIIPRIRQQLSYNAQDLATDRVRDIRPLYDSHSDILIGGQGTILRSREIDRPTFFLPSGLDHYGGQLTAKRARYCEADQNHAAGYLLTDVAQPANLSGQPSLKLGDQPVIITPRDANWLQPKECFVVSDVDFEQLTGGRGGKQFSSTRELIAALRNPSSDYGSGTRVAIHSRFVRPLMDMLVLLLGLPLVLSRENRNPLLAAMLSMIVVGLFMGVTMACRYLGENLTIDPALAAWCPLMIFAPVAAALGDPLWE
jgi:lipopolysaccharide export system permease protein